MNNWVRMLSKLEVSGRRNWVSSLPTCVCVCVSVYVPEGTFLERVFDMGTKELSQKNRIFLACSSPMHSTSTAAAIQHVGQWKERRVSRGGIEGSGEAEQYRFHGKRRGQQTRGDSSKQTRGGLNGQCMDIFPSRLHYFEAAGSNIVSK